MDYKCTSILHGYSPRGEWIINVPVSCMGIVQGDYKCTSKLHGYSPRGEWIINVPVSCMGIVQGVNGL